MIYPLPNPPSFFDFEKEDLQYFLSSLHFPQRLARRLFGLGHKLSLKQPLPFFPILSEEMLLPWEKHLSFSLPRRDLIQQSADGTVKFLMGLADGLQVETVLIPFGKRFSVCLSTQVGCGMKCSFCSTGLQGLKRNLSAGEIVGQYLSAWSWLLLNLPQKSQKPKIVFMGQGEPLHNFEQVKKAVHILLAEEGAYLGPRQITLSTAGYLPGLKRFGELKNINFALSLHSPFDEIRNQLIPLNRTYPLASLFATIDQIAFKPRQYINCEYLMIAGLNDRQEDIKALEKWAQGRPVIVNLIPFNSFPGSTYQRPAPQKVVWFQQQLLGRNIFTTVRTTKGDEILAACGQLRVQNARGTEKHF